MLIDKAKDVVERFGGDPGFRTWVQMAQALIAVDNILKEYIDYPKWKDGTYLASEAMLAEEIRKAIESTEDTKEDKPSEAEELKYSPHPIVEDKPDAEGWIAYNGEGQPVDNEVMIEVNLRYYKDILKAPAGAFDWIETEGGTAYDVISYRTIVEEPRKPEKQTLLEFMDKKAGYNAIDLQTEAALECREVYRNISEWLEQYLENKED